MYTEVELKYEVKDFGQIRENLEKCGGKLLVDESEEKNIVFDTPERTLKTFGKLLRLRNYQGKTILTVKEQGMVSTMKIRKEHETILSITIEAAEEMLKVLGYIPVFHYEKTREIWSMVGNVHICLDSLFFGKFIEIEAETELDVSNASRILGLNLDEGLNQSYRHLQKMRSHKTE